MKTFVVDASVGAARSVENDAFLRDATQDVYDFTLDGGFVGLDLPAVEVGAVVGDGQFEMAHAYAGGKDLVLKERSARSGCRA